jgi:hypothetical protein
MAQIDPKQERARLAALYATMSDLELQKVGRDPDALTPWAREAILAEMNKRSLEWKPEEKQSGPIYLEKPTVIRRYRDMPAAYIDKSVLENAGIMCFLQDDNIVRMDWLWSNAMGGIKLVVREKDAEEALKILEETKSIDPEDPESPESSP